MVIAPAKTGSDKSNKIVVIKVDHKNSGIRSRVIPFGRIFIIVVIKLIEPKMDEIPARCKLKIARSTDIPEWDMFEARGGYTVQPVPAPFSTMDEVNKRLKEGGKSQNLMLFIRGKAISGVPSIIGISQFPNPPIMIGITIKKIITKA